MVIWLTVNGVARASNKGTGWLWLVLVTFMHINQQVSRTQSDKLNSTRFQGMYQIVEGPWKSGLNNVESVEHPLWEVHRNDQALSYVFLSINILAQKKIQIDVEFNHHWPFLPSVFFTMWVMYNSAK